VIGKRLALLLLTVAAYYVAAGLVIQSLQLRVIERGGVGSLINTLILSLLMSFRNRAAYARWWEARGLWGQLTNDSRNTLLQGPATRGLGLERVDRALAYRAGGWPVELADGPAGVLVSLRRRVDRFHRRGTFRPGSR
jgi:putative membrane protein